MWLDAGDAFVERVDAVAASLAKHSRKYKEIERKYLLRAMPVVPDDAQLRDIDQGYLPGTRVRERVRRIRSPDGETRFYRTLKFGEGVVRTEIEEEIDASMFDGLWALTEGRRIRKRRYAVPEGDHTWEIDEFLDRDLVLAEVELAEADETADLPTWLAPVVVRDVTDEPAYTNATLALGDGRVAEHVEKDLDEEDGGQHDSDASANHPPIAKDPFVLPLRERRREQPAVEQAPSA